MFRKPLFIKLTEKAGKEQVETQSFQESINDDESFSLSNSSQLEQLPDDIILQIAQYTPLDALSFWSNTTQANRNTLQPALTITGVLSAVVQGNQRLAYKLLHSHPERLIQKNNITDFSGRIFHHASPWQCMLWALDTRFMGRMMVSCIPPGDEGYALREELIKQFDEIQGGGEDLVNLQGARSPIEQPFADVEMLFENKDAIIFWNDKVYYANKQKLTIKEIHPVLTEQTANEFSVLKASIISLPANKARKSNDTEHEFIASVLGYRLARRGLHYELDGIQYCDSHYDFGVIDAWEKYQTNFTLLNWEQRDKLLLEVGKKQREFTAHVAQHYVKDSQHVIPSNQLIRSFEFQRFTDQSIDHIFPLDQKGVGLGYEFTLIRGPAKAVKRCIATVAWINLTALDQLYTQRKADGLELRDILAQEQIATPRLPLP